MADLNTMFYDKHKIRISMRTEKKVDIGEKQGVMRTEKTIIHGTDKDPRLMATKGLSLALANEDNIDKIMTDLEQCEKKIAQIKGTLKRERDGG